MPDLVTATLPDRTLAQIVQSDRIIPVERTIEILVALLQSRLNTPKIHGQITPDRVVIVAEHPVRVQILPAADLRADPEFSAPEILDGKISDRSDLYSIGLIAIYLLTGTRPFQLFDTANRCWVWQDYWQIDRTTSRIDLRQLVAILDRAIELDADLRFSSAREMMAAVRDCYPALLPATSSWECCHILTGHAGLFAAIKTIAISPDLLMVATGSEDTTIRLWDIDTGAGLGILTGHQQSIDTIVFHPHKSGLLYSSGKDGLIKLWNVKTAAEVISIDSQQSKINCLAISPDGKLLISASRDRAIKIWYLGLTDEQSIDNLITLKTHQLSVNAIAFNPIASDVKFASVSSDRRVMLWGLESKTPVCILTAHTQAVKALAFSPNGKLLATAGDDGSIHIWDLEHRQLTKTLSAHRWTISGLAFCKDGDSLISTSWDGNIKFWQIDTGREIECLTAHEAEVLAIDICRSPGCLVTASRDRTAKIWKKSL
ncbi:WD40 repeat domain-containing serine/threonine-protein kinase [Chamaesiphon minutus]|uniref:WD40 repeat-containing protein n=1 Tax=Chamaesiphon minutus (strain ATCC 27169 / PCC 6605) TaxID=1173020 RepID=K9UG49_CHAP6|nr:WD40 repeat domain-containing serine/threonine-protein kinase [Chamaesiphon minutus]AFY93391.1 WD40 repeat-containing protein [Chamaesiphon minutus PCC 6605]